MCRGYLPESIEEERDMTYEAGSCKRLNWIGSGWTETGEIKHPNGGFSMSHTRQFRTKGTRAATFFTVKSVWAGLVMLAAFSALPAFGATITVTNTNDSGPGSLRAAIAGAANGDIINFSVTGTITLTSGELLVAKNLTISGPGAANLAISGNNSSRVFNVGSVTVVISGLTVQSGNANNDALFPQWGGGIFNAGTLDVRNSAVSGNSAGEGGGIYNDQGTVTLTHSTLSRNSAGIFGAGILNFMGTVTVANSTLSDNHASGNFDFPSGGGIYNTTSSTLTVNNSTLSRNGAFRNFVLPGESIPGGAIYNAGTATVTNSTLSDNAASTDGGGIFNSGTFLYGATLTVTNSTFSGNGAGRNGGAIFNSIYGTATLTNTTLSGNSAFGLVALFFNGSGGAAIFNVGTLTAKNSILANSPAGGNCVLAGPVTSQGHNLSDDASCGLFGGFLGTGDVNNTAAGLSPNDLQNNGGPTMTIALLPNSPAVNAIPVSPTNYCTATDGTTPIATDQRGVPRPQGPGCDIGAFELRQPDDGVQ